MPAAQKYTTDQLIALHQAESSSTDSLIKAHQEEMKTERNPNTAVESAIRGGLQSATFGFLDEGEGVAKTLRDVVKKPGDVKGLSDLVKSYQKNRDASRVEDEYARKDNPNAYTLGELGGGIATAFIPGLGIGKAAEAGSLLGKAWHAAKAGAVIGAGTSNADLTKGDAGNFVEDVETGAVTGAATQGVLSAGGKLISGLTPSNVAKKAANVFLNTPEEITDVYMKSPQAVMNAPRRFELARDIETNGLDKLKTLVTEGSQESRDILTKEGQTFKGSDIARIYNQKANEIAKRSEGVMTDPERIAAYNYLKQSAEKFASGIDPETGKALPKILTTNRVKDELQTLDRMTEYDIGAGQFGKIDNAVKKDVRNAIDTRLKNKSPEYKKQMIGVANDAQLLDEASSIASNPKGWSNVLKRVETDKYGAGQLPRDTLEKVDKRLGTDFLDQAMYSNAREAFDKSITNGSMNVNKFSNMLKDVPILKYAAPLIGATVDKYGRELTLQAINGAISLNGILDKEGPQILNRAVTPLLEAAKKGNTAAILTYQIFSESNPKAAKAIQNQSAFQRRSQGEK